MSWSVDVPTIPTLPGQPNASVTFFDATTLDKTIKRKGRKIHYIEGPIVCDGTYLLLDGRFSYEGGITNTVLREIHDQGRAALPVRTPPAPPGLPRRAGSQPDLMRVAVISDIHSNLPALAAVLADIDEQRPATRSGAWATWSATARCRTPAPRWSPTSPTSAWPVTTTSSSAATSTSRYFTTAAEAAARWTMEKSAAARASS